MSAHGTFQIWLLRLAMSAYRRKGDLADSMIAAELVLPLVRGMFDLECPP
jgi:hypothetical protein